MEEEMRKNNNNKIPFLKRKNTKRAFLILAILFISMFSFFMYLYAEGSKIFQDNGRMSFLNNLKNSLGSDPKLAGADNDRINIVFMGIGGSNHPGGQLTDSMMIVSIKPKENALAMISIPRDLFVPISNRNQKVKINEVYTIGEKEKKGSGPELVKKTLENILGIPVQYHVTLDFAGFEKIIDQLGGVDILVERAINDPYYPDTQMKGYDPFSIKAGQQKLSGKVALKYARSRETTSDFDRSARQQKILVAVKDKMLSMGFLANPVKIAEIVSTLGNHLRTNVSPGEIRSFAAVLKNIDRNKIISKVLSNGTDGVLYSDSSSGTYYLMPKGGDYKEIERIVEGIFDTNNEINQVKLEILNGTSTAGLGMKASDDLENSGYNVIAVSNSKEKVAETIIYDYSNGKYEQTLNYLKKKYNAQSLQKKATESQKSDLVIIVGKNFDSASSR